MPTMRGAARSHHSRTSLHDLASIPSTATQSVPRLTPQLLSHCITYTMAVGESVTSFAPSWHYGGKNGGRGFVDLFSPFHLFLRTVVVAPTKEERVFHLGSAESSVGHTWTQHLVREATKQMTGQGTSAWPATKAIGEDR